MWSFIVNYKYQSEHNLMTTIISELHWIKVFESLVSGPMNYFIKLGEVNDLPCIGYSLDICSIRTCTIEQRKA